MPNPLLFFIFVIVIDLVLKSVKDKKKIEQSRQNRTEEIQKQPTKQRPLADLRKLLEEEVMKEKQREIARRQGTPIESQASKSKAQVVKKKEEHKDVNIQTQSWDIKTEEKKFNETPNPSASQVDNSIKNLKQDVLRGIIFSEILSEPKSIQNQRKSS
ncbi:hypothetical protein [Tissierella sp.]|uniref:hypothetical protein n=1 Tax=Tissierella sp. TaxID=41274 RepID=UPI002856861A|nr:hypothetical protein [Tissierella sp.]MDR7857117.1 hypothetical protein [Tissierella sp.]